MRAISALRESAASRPRKRGRSTKKQAIFGVYKRGGQVFTEIVPDVKSKTLQGLMRATRRVSS